MEPYDDNGVVYQLEKSSASQTGYLHVVEPRPGQFHAKLKLPGETKQSFLPGAACKTAQEAALRVAKYPRARSGCAAQLAAFALSDLHVVDNGSDGKFAQGSAGADLHFYFAILRLVARHPIFDNVANFEALGRKHVKKLLGNMASLIADFNCH